MYCFKCGAEVKDESALFCSRCGQNFADFSAQNQAPKIPNKSNNKKSLIITLIGLGAVALVIILLYLAAKLLCGPKDIDITHGGEEKYISDGEYEWRFDYDWAKFDEDWDGHSKKSNLEVVGALLNDDFLSLFDGMTDEDYIEARLNPIHYDKNSYWDMAPSSMVKSAEESWQKYLKDHKELKGMYIIVNGEKLYPYKDDDFDKNSFMNPTTATSYAFDDTYVLSSDDGKDEYSKLDYELCDDFFEDELDGYDDTITFTLHEADGEFTLWACEVYDDGDNGYNDYGEYDYDAFEGEMYAFASKYADITFKVIYPDGTIYSECPIDDYNRSGEYTSGTCGIASYCGSSSDDDGNDIYQEPLYGTYRIVMECHNVKDVTVKFGYADDMYWKEGGSDFDYQIFAPGAY